MCVCVCVCVCVFVVVSCLGHTAPATAVSVPSTQAITGKSACQVLLSADHLATTPWHTYSYTVIRIGVVVGIIGVGKMCPGSWKSRWMDSVQPYSELLTAVSVLSRPTH